eukprot:Skav232872  [mRNA]  locus=scaffold8221:558:5792:+ [translate_table: standard]
MNGTFYTADHAKNMEGEKDTACLFCGQQDGIFHRHWECEELAAARKCSPEMKQCILQAGPATYNHGWIPSPPSLIPFQQKLSALPDTTGWHTVPSNLPHTLDLFTDGGCLHPRDCLSRLASWGLVAYTPLGEQEFTPVSGGVVPGFTQSAARAELFAALSALRLADKLQQPFRIWVDNAQVFKTLRRSLNPAATEAYRVRNKVKNHDLINDLGTLGFQTKHLSQQIIKVCSRQSHASQDDWIAHWSWRGNDSADQTATSAVHEHPELMTIWEKLASEIREREQMRDELHSTLIAVGNLAQEKQDQKKQSQREPEAQDQAERPSRQHVAWSIPDTVPAQATYLECPDLEQLHTWSTALHTPTEPVRWWTWQQLFIDAQLMFPGIGPWHHGTSHAWKAGAVCPEAKFAKRARSFSTYLTKLAKLSGQPLPVILSRPDSHAYSFWTKTLPVKVSASRCQAIDDWLLQWGTMRCHKEHNRIDRLPGNRVVRCPELRSLLPPRGDPRRRYLDTDVVVQSDLSELISKNLHGHPAGKYVDVDKLKSKTLQSQGPLWRAGVSQPPFLMALAGKYEDLGAQFNVRGLGRGDIAPEEVRDAVLPVVGSSGFG